MKQTSSSLLKYLCVLHTHTKKICLQVGLSFSSYSCSAETHLEVSADDSACLSAQLTQPQNSLSIKRTQVLALPPAGFAMVWQDFFYSSQRTRTQSWNKQVTETDRGEKNQLLLKELHQQIESISGFSVKSLMQSSPQTPPSNFIERDGLLLR